MLVNPSPSPSPPKSIIHLSVERYRENIILLALQIGPRHEWNPEHSIRIPVHQTLRHRSTTPFAILNLTQLIIKITISSIVIGLKNSYFPLIHLSSCYRTVCYRTPCYRTVCYRTVQ